MKKTLFHTITIKVPSNQLFIGKNGSVSIVQSLTKNNAITKRLGIPSITLQKDEHILHPEIIEDGDVEDYNDVKVRQKKLKMIKKRLEELPKKKLITKEKLKYALSQLPKKAKQEEIESEIESEIEEENENEDYYLEDYLEIKEPAETDNSIHNQIMAIIYNEMFNIVNNMYTVKEMEKFQNELNITYNTYEYIKNWFDKKSNSHVTIDYSDFVKLLIYPLLLKQNIKVDKVKLMLFSNNIANDAMFRNYFLKNNELNKYTIMKTFISKKNPEIIKKLSKNKEFENLFEDLQNTADVRGHTGFQNPSYKAKSKILQFLNNRKIKNKK